MHPVNRIVNVKVMKIALIVENLFSDWQPSVSDAERPILNLARNQNRPAGKALISV